MKVLKAKIAEKKNKQIKIKTDFIRLDSALKLADLVQSGGHAKAVIQDGEVKVNGEICPSRGKKLRAGDKFEFDLYVVEVVNE
ncbi:MAG: RNA-binding S4 domain-containing protein [Clostridiales bacterium]|nr:RNA-binding S4 domain-containing protein [Clostridiales bacterium]